MEGATESIEEDLYDVSIKSLRSETRKKISRLLNPLKILPSENEKLRDWRGLAELMCIESQYLQQLGNEKDPTHEIISIWHEKYKSEATIRNFISFLEKIDRFDVIDDCDNNFKDDIEYFKNRSNTSTENGFDSTVDVNLTYEDAKRSQDGQDLIKYNALVLAANEDVDFASEVLEKMEKEYNLKLISLKRDILPGLLEFDVTIKMISKRCHKLLLIISPAFFAENTAHRYFVSYAQYIGIERQQRTIVPCIYRDCELPEELKCLSKLYYNSNASCFYDFWNRMYESLAIKKAGQKSACRTHSNPHSILSPAKDGTTPLANGFRNVFYQQQHTNGSNLLNGVIRANSIVKPTIPVIKTPLSKTTSNGKNANSRRLGATLNGSVRFSTSCNDLQQASNGDAGDSNSGLEVNIKPLSTSTSTGILNVASAVSLGDSTPRRTSDTLNVNVEEPNTKVKLQKSKSFLKKIKHKFSKKFHRKKKEVVLVA